MSSDNTEDSLTQFNQIFTDYCYKLYGEKYFLNYNPDWENQKNSLLLLIHCEVLWGQERKRV